MRPPGVDLGALQLVIQPVLDQLPEIAIPDTIARIRVTPNERVESGTRLIQRALHAEISIAGQQLFDVVAGEATVGLTDVGCGGVADLALQCSLRRLVLIDVYEQGGRVRLLGAADRRYVGRRVRIRFMADRPHRRATEGAPRRHVRGDRTAPARGHPRHQPRALRGADRQAAFDAAEARAAHAGDVNAQPRRSRDDRRARRAAAHDARSRRSWSSAASPAALEGGQALQAARRRRASASACARRGDGEAAVYRMTTRVKHFSWFTKTYPTFTLPRYVDLG